MKEHRLVMENGVMRFVYDDALVPLIAASGGVTTRASHVEPASTYCGGCSRPYVGSGTHVCVCALPRRPVADAGWVADMHPMGGPLLGTYVTHQEGLDGERAWLREHCGL
jgi:hypothetical protein